MMAYKDLPEKFQIQLRIKMAQVIAIEDLSKGIDLTDALKWCIDNEQYCGAEGIKRALEKSQDLHPGPTQTKN